MMTDDPDTPGPGYWEINVASLLDKTAREHTLEIPRVDANYGVGERIQLKFEVPWVRFGNEEGAIITGAGTAAAGVKWRFIGQEGKKVAWSIYPQFSFYTARSSIDKGISEEGREFLMPTEITIEFAHVEINGEIGRNFVQDGADNWLYGLSTESHVGKRLELLAEIHGEQVPDDVSDVFINVGARGKLTKKMILLLAIGRTVQSSHEAGPRLYLYTGIQFNLPGLYSFAQTRPPAARPRRP